MPVRWIDRLPCMHQALIINELLVLLCCRCRGVVSWGWFYPYHYSPMMSDLVNLGSISPQFERGEPFTPYQQLLAVLPAASYRLLPKPYQVIHLAIELIGGWGRGAGAWGGGGGPLNGPLVPK